MMYRFYGLIFVFIYLVSDSSFVFSQARVGHVSFQETPVPQYSKFEILIDTLWGNNQTQYRSRERIEAMCNSDSIQLWAEFVSPHGKIYKVPGFFKYGAEVTGQLCNQHKPYPRENFSMPEKMDAWCIRFSPTEAGEWKFKLSIIEHGLAFSNIYIQSFTCIHQSKSKGLVRLRDKRTLGFENGERFIPIGQNVSTHTMLIPDEMYCYHREYLDSMVKSGLNMWRVLTGGSHGMVLQGINCSWMNIQNPRIHLSDYDQRMSYILDTLLSYSDANEIKFMFQMFSGTVYVTTEYTPFELGSWYLNYLRDSIVLVNKYEGEIVWRKTIYQPNRLKQPAEFFRMENPLVNRIVKDYIKYIVARYGYNPSLICWEPMGEIGRVISKDKYDSLFDGTKGLIDYANNSDLIVWMDSIKSWINDLDYYHRPFSPSRLGSNIKGDIDFPERDYTWDTVAVSQFYIYDSLSDIVQTHSYGYFDRKEDGSFIGTSQPDNFYREGVAYTSFYPNKPFFMGEGGWPGMNKNYQRLDPEGFDVHNGLYSSLFNGGCGSQLFWDFGEVMNQHWFGLWTPVKNFVNQAPLLLSENFLNVYKYEYQSDKRISNYINKELRFFCISNSSQHSEVVSGDTLYGWIQRKSYTIENLIANHSNYLKLNDATQKPRNITDSVLVIRVAKGKINYRVELFDTESGSIVSRFNVQSRRKGYKKYYVYIPIPRKLLNGKYGDAAMGLYTF